MTQKQLIDDYEVLHSVRLDGTRHIVAINADLEKSCRLYESRCDNVLGVEEIRLILSDHDYIRVMREFVRRLSARLDSLDLDRTYRGTLSVDFPVMAAECVHDGMGTDLSGKVIAIRKEALSPEYRAKSHQLHLATGGFGCSPTARGRAVYCTNLYSGEQTRFSREDVLGVVVDDNLPGWAQRKLAALREPPEKESVLAKIREAKPETEKGAAEKPKTPKPHEPDR
jgi:hypothetical protein